MLRIRREAQSPHPQKIVLLVNMISATSFFANILARDRETRGSLLCVRFRNYVNCMEEKENTTYQIAAAHCKSFKTDLLVYFI